MTMFLVAVISAYLAIDWVATFRKWMENVSKKKYWWGFADTMLTGALLIGVIILAGEVL